MAGRIVAHKARTRMSMGAASGTNCHAGPAVEISSQPARARPQAPAALVVRLRLSKSCRRNQCASKYEALCLAGPTQAEFGAPPLSDFGPAFPTSFDLSPDEVPRRWSLKHSQGIWTRPAPRSIQTQPQIRRRTDADAQTQTRRQRHTLRRAPKRDRLAAQHNLQRLGG